MNKLAMSDRTAGILVIIAVVGLGLIGLSFNLRHQGNGYDGYESQPSTAGYGGGGGYISSPTTGHQSSSSSITASQIVDVMARSDIRLFCAAERITGDTKRARLAFGSSYGYHPGYPSANQVFNELLARC